MKMDDFKNQLKKEVLEICEKNGWKYDNNKQRGMAFEDWCFNLLAERFSADENDRQDCIIRTDDFSIDVVFESRENREAYLLQCKFEKPAANDPIEEETLKAFFSNADLLKDPAYIKNRKSNNERIEDLAGQYQYWTANDYTVHFVFVSTFRSTDKTRALEHKSNARFKDQQISFHVWDIDALKEEYLSVKSVEQLYPDMVTFDLAAGQYLKLAGEPSNITFAVRGTTLQTIFRQHKDRLFNWNIRRFLGRKGQVNQGMTATLDKEPQFFFYYNNGISALCDSFEFDEQAKRLRVHKLQIVNGAQTMGALGAADESKASQAFVLVKLTALRNAHKETGPAAALIKSNNTQNSLRLPDFRSNDPIQLWLEQAFKDSKPQGDLPKIIYGRKRPYTRVAQGSMLLKMQDLGKIRYAWLEDDPRIPIAEPSKLFELKEDGGLYSETFGARGAMVTMYTEDQFREVLLAIHSFNKLFSALRELEETGECKQLSRLKYYGLHLFKMYIDKNEADGAVKRADLYLLGKKYDEFLARGMVVIQIALENAYKEILEARKGTAFSLPRDSKVWDLVQKKYTDAIKMETSFRNKAKP